MEPQARIADGGRTGDLHSTHWQAPFGSARRLVGIAIMLVGTLLFAPIPLSNLPPGLAIVLLAFAYLEEDRMLICVALVIITRASVDCRRSNLAGDECSRLDNEAALIPDFFDLPAVRLLLWQVLWQGFPLPPCLC
ncbi:MAG TPA: exopolysaccharide biosynthesis protein [Acetobacteraceae bacterium]|nr:exopolysaccharide biosynthesis protein [Acetobacteraceae bacterium]